MKRCTINYMNLSPPSGWTLGASSYLPVLSIDPPAPKAVLELIKCNCKTECKTLPCGCRKNGLPCTNLCGCKDCENVPEFIPNYFLSDDDDDDDDYDDFF